MLKQSSAPAMVTTGLPLEIWKTCVVPHFEGPQGSLTRIRLRLTCRALSGAIGCISADALWVARQLVEENRPGVLRCLVNHELWRDLPMHQRMPSDERPREAFATVASCGWGQFERLSAHTARLGRIECLQALRGSTDRPCPLNIGTLLAASERNDEALFALAMDEYATEVVRRSELSQDLAVLHAMNDGLRILFLNLRRPFALHYIETMWSKLEERSSLYNGQWRALLSMLECDRMDVFDDCLGSKIDKPILSDFGWYLKTMEKDARTTVIYNFNCPLVIGWKSHRPEWYAYYHLGASVNAMKARLENRYRAELDAAVNERHVWNCYLDDWIMHVWNAESFF